MLFDKNNVLWDLDGTIVRSEDAEFKFAMFEFASNKIGLKFKLLEGDYVGKEAQYIFKKTLVRNNNILSSPIEYELQYKKWYEYAISYILIILII